MTPRLHRQSGYSLIELAIVLAVISVLIGVAMPMFAGMSAQAKETAAREELRDAIAPLKGYLMDGDPTLGLQEGIHALSGGVRFDDAAVLGIRIEAAADGAVCMWRLAETGRVLGIWVGSGGGVTLYAELAAIPSCPAATGTVAAGFVSSW